MTTAVLEPEATPFNSFLKEILPTATAIKDPLQAIRTQARRKFEEIGLPGKQDEAFQYFPLRSLYEDSLIIPSASSVLDQDLIEPHIVPECQGRCIVFVDGRYRPELSLLDQLDPKIGIFVLEDAMKTFGHFLNARMTKQIKEEKDPFVLLNLAVHSEGAFLYIPPKLVVNEPIQVLHVMTQESALTAPRLQVFVGSQAHVKLFSSSCACYLQGGFSLDVIDFALEEGASVECLTTACVRPRGWSMEFVRGSLKNDSSLNITQISKKTVCQRRDIRIDLLGENASTKVRGLAMLADKEQSHTRIIVNHEAPHTQSMQHFKGILSGLSQSSFEGKIVVKRPAQKTQAYQLCNHLLLGERAIANTKPNLEIFADDVKASHGATMAQLKEEEIFYLKSRGIGLAQAKNLLVEAFSQQIASTIFLSTVRKRLEKYIKLYAQES